MLCCNNYILYVYTILHKYTTPTNTFQPQLYTIYHIKRYLKNYNKKKLYQRFLSWNVLLKEVSMYGISGALHMHACLHLIHIPDLQTCPTHYATHDACAGVCITHREHYCSNEASHVPGCCSTYPVHLFIMCFDARKWTATSTAATSSSYIYGTEKQWSSVLCVKYSYSFLVRACFIVLL